MAKNKIERIDQEIEKTREKIAEYQEKLNLHPRLFALLPFAHTSTGFIPLQKI